MVDCNLQKQLSIVPLDLECARKRPERTLISRHIGPQTSPSRIRVPFAADLPIPEHGGEGLDLPRNTRSSSKVLEADNLLEDDGEPDYAHVLSQTEVGSPSEVNIALDRAVETDGLRFGEYCAVVIGRGEVKQEPCACSEFMRGATAARVCVGQRVQTIWIRWIRLGGREVSNSLVFYHFPGYGYSPTNTDAFEHAARQSQNT